MRVLVIGDIHGRWSIADRLYHEVISKDIDVVMQVGDFGYWPRSMRRVWDLNLNHDHQLWWIDGNHEDHESLKDIDDPYLGLDPYYSYPDWKSMMSDWDYKPRGHIEKGILFIGGAKSIDKDQRTPGLDWFPEENISTRQQMEILDGIEEYGAEKIHTVFSHDCCASFDMSELCESKELVDTNREFLEEVRRVVRPERWIFGHYHERHEGTHENTDYRCVGMVDNGDFHIVDLPDEV